MDAAPSRPEARGRVVVTGFALAVSPGHAPVWAQPTDSTPRVGFLGRVASDISQGFKLGLKELRLVEDHDLVVEWRWTAPKANRVPILAAELVALTPAVIVNTATHASAAVKERTGTARKSPNPHRSGGCRPFASSATTWWPAA